MFFNVHSWTFTQPVFNNSPAKRLKKTKFLVKSKDKFLRSPVSLLSPSQIPKFCVDHKLTNQITQELILLFS